MFLNDQHLNEFKSWLAEKGAIVESTKGEWEVLRFVTDQGVCVIYRNSKGDQTWSSAALAIYESFTKKRQLSLAPDRSSRKKLRHFAADLAERDGLECWFCAYSFLGPDSLEVTIEHLVSHAHGGPNHPSNLVLSCKPCNEEAGHLPVSQKVALREKKRNLVAVNTA